MSDWITNVRAYLLVFLCHSNAATSRKVNDEFGSQLGILDLTVNVVRCSMSVRRYSLNFAPRPTPRGRDGKELIQCPTSSCDGMGHVSGNYATHRRQDIDIYTEIFDVNAQLCIYRYGDAARTYARYIHTKKTHIHNNTNNKNLY